MTTAQITEIIGSANVYVSGTKTRLHIPSINYIAFSKDKNVIRGDIRDVRFLFDSANEILEVVYCRPFSQIYLLPAHGNYDIMDLNGVSTIFEHLSDFETGDLLVDYFTFESITTIGLK
jgi:hypothetical protein